MKLKIHKDEELSSLRFHVVIVVVDLPQTPEDDLRSARAACEGGLVSHSWCICVISHDYGGLGGGRDGCVGWYACGTKPRGVGCMS